MSQALTQWLETIGIINQGEIYYNPDRSKLITQSIINNEGQLTHSGAFCTTTTPYTGRSPEDKYIVDYQDNPDLWWGIVNHPILPDGFEKIKNRMTAYMSSCSLYVIDCAIGANPEHQYSLRVITEFAWQALAAQNLFRYNGFPHNHPPEITIMASPGFQTDPAIDHTRTSVGICLDLKQKLVLVAGSKYVGEIKKSAFTIMNALMPESGVLPMHCSANVGENGESSLYFGLSGTGKTTLSSATDRRLVGDDEHGWGDNGIFNFEGGCYAKVIRLSSELEPVIWQATNQFGTVLENVIIDPETRQPNFDDARITENTRAAYPLSHVENTDPEGTAGHPTNIIFLTADAFGVIPPIAKLNPDQAIYYYLSGYTSKVAGTERGLESMPQATFSTCFGEPFLPLKPYIYAQLLKDKLEKFNSHVWLLNTGWTGGDFHTGYRMPLPHTRRMVNWILSGEHQNAAYHSDPIFEIDVPDEIEGIPKTLLYPQKTWEDQSAFHSVSQKLKQDFENNYEKLNVYL